MQSDIRFYERELRRRRSKKGLAEESDDELEEVEVEFEDESD
jgi:hypothetical protein